MFPCVLFTLGFLEVLAPTWIRWGFCGSGAREFQPRAARTPHENKTDGKGEEVKLQVRFCPLPVPLGWDFGWIKLIIYLFAVIDVLVHWGKFTFKPTVLLAEKTKQNSLFATAWRSACSRQERTPSCQVYRFFLIVVNELLACKMIMRSTWAVPPPAGDKSAEIPQKTANCWHLPWDFLQEHRLGEFL